MLKIALFQIIKFNVSTLISSIWPIDRTLSGATIPRPEWTWELWHYKSTSHFPKLLTTRVFRVPSWALARVGHSPLQRCSRCILQHKQLGSLGHSFGGGGISTLAMLSAFKYKDWNKKKVYQATKKHREELNLKEIYFIIL